MKNLKKYIFVIICFILIMIFILIFFIIRYNKIHLLNNSRDLLEYLYTLEKGEYHFKKGAIYNTDGNIINTDYYIDGIGNIDIDKYGNVKFYINTKDYCISKTSLGNINILNDRCLSFKDINALVIKNNSSISFKLDYDNLEYKISSKDDFKGKWLKEDYDTNLIIKSYNSGDNYIWFKDNDGNISASYHFNVECLDGKDMTYDNKSFYCKGAVVNLDNTDWIVLDDNISETTLMKYYPLDTKLSHCFDYKSEYCYYGDGVKEFTWKNSYINHYLNNIYYYELSKYTQKKIKSVKVCNNYLNIGCENNEGCGGYSEDIINSNDWYCDDYVETNIRLINYLEYNDIVSSIPNKNVLNGYYWSINSYKKNKGSSILYNGDFYIEEEYTNRLDVKPVIVVSKD